MKKDKQQIPKKNKTQLKWHKEIRIAVQALIWGLIGVFVGCVYGIVKGMNLLYAINRFLYIVGLALLCYAIMPGDVMANKDFSDRETSPLKELEEKLKERKARRQHLFGDFFRAVLVLSFAMLLETIRFYLL